MTLVAVACVVPWVAATGPCHAMLCPENIAGFDQCLRRYMASMHWHCVPAPDEGEYEQAELSDAQARVRVPVQHGVLQ